MKKILLSSIVMSVLMFSQAFAANTSYYGSQFHGKRAANGSIYNMHALTAAHKTLPFGTKVKVTNSETKESVIVKITDRGPYIKGRVLDLSKAASNKINCKLCNTDMKIISYGDGKYRKE